jgi:hypothetical protein
MFTKIGHRHFWERAVSRRDVLLGAAAAAGVAAGARLLSPFSGAPALAASGADPRPIPGGILVVDGQRFVHAYPPGPSNPVDPASPLSDPSTIADFDGVVAITQTQGKGTAVEQGMEVPVVFDADMRFLTGRYVGTDGQVHEGTFGFI